MCGCWEHKPVCAARGGSDWTFGTMSAWEGMLSTVQLPRAGGVSEPRGFGSWGCAGWAQSSFPALCKTPFSFGRFLSGFVLFREPQHRAVTLLVAPRDSPCTICHFLNHSQQMMLTKTLPGQGEERAQRRVSSFYHHFCILLKTPAKTRPVLLQSCIWVFFSYFYLKCRALGGAECWECIICIDIKCILETKSFLVCTTASINISLKIWSEDTKLWVWCLEVLSSHSEASCASEE